MARFVTLAVAVFMCTAVALTAPLKPYPGAKADERLSKAATKSLVALGEKTARLKATAYLTDDAYETVRAYYLARGKEFFLPAKPEHLTTLPSGERVKEMFVILDGANNLAVSSSWVKVQRPFVGSMRMVEEKVVFDDVRDVTVITIVGQK